MNSKIKTQSIIGFVLLLAVMFWSYSMGGKLEVYMVSGLLVGYALSRSRFGYAGGVKRIYMTGDDKLSVALFAMFVITSLVVAGIHFMAVKHGMDFDHMKIYANVKPLDIGVLIGGFLFGAGMIMAGGCASGTLTDLGEGAGRSLVALIFFIIGAPVGHYMRVVHNNAGLDEVGVKLYLPDLFGARDKLSSYMLAVILIALGFLVLYYITDRYSKKRKAAGTQFDPEWEEIEKPLPLNPKKKFFSYETYHKLFIERWSYMTGALIISLIFAFIYVAAGKAWGVTSSFTTAGVWLFGNLGVDFEAIGGFGKPLKQAADIMHHAGTLRNITTVLGATIAFLLAGRFKLNFKFSAKDAAFYALGGFLMGVGARVARGCNVGALYAAITSLSLHGWGFLITMVLGAIWALKALEGKLNIIPKRNI